MVEEVYTLQRMLKEQFKKDNSRRVIMGMYKLTVYLEGANTTGGLGMITADDDSCLIAIIGIGLEDNVYKIQEYRKLISKYSYYSHKDYVLIIGYGDSNMTCAIPFRNIRTIIGETLEGGN